MNFLHLTGVETNLQSKEFYDKCVSGCINADDFWDSPKKNKSTIRKKLAHLVHVDSYFEQEFLVQEDFAKNTIRCIVATTDGKCTIGFIDARYYAAPNTILDKNCLDPTKPIVRVKPKY